MTEEKRQSTPITWGQLVTGIGIISVLLGIFSTVHSQIVIPHIVVLAREQARKDAQALLDAHSLQPLHSGAASKGEVKTYFGLIRDDLKEMREDQTARIKQLHDALSKRIDRIEAK